MSRKCWIRTGGDESGKKEDIFAGVKFRYSVYKMKTFSHKKEGKYNGTNLFIMPHIRDEGEMGRMDVISSYTMNT